MKNLIATLEESSVQSCSFFVAGKPETQGSKKAFGRAYTDQAGRQRVAVSMVEQSKGLHAWRASMGRMAKLFLPPGWEVTGLFSLSVVFYMPRPASHFNSKGALKNSAPVFHVSKGDTDKLLRACGDALTKICYEDDAMIIAVSGIKLFCDPVDGPGACIRVSRLDSQTALNAVLAPEA